MHNMLDGCELRPDWTTDNRVSCPSVSKIYTYIHICNGEDGVSTFSRLFSYLLALM